MRCMLAQAVPVDEVEGAWATFVDRVAEAGPFALGSLFGAGLFLFSERGARRERMETEKNRSAREQEILRQSSVKDKRLQEMHDLLKESNKPTS